MTISKYSLYSKCILFDAQSKLILSTEQNMQSYILCPWKRVETVSCSSILAMKLPKVILRCHVSEFLFLFPRSSGLDTHAPRFRFIENATRATSSSHAKICVNRFDSLSSNVPLE